jgi:hypothetical protein
MIEEPARTIILSRPGERILNLADKIVLKFQKRRLTFDSQPTNKTQVTYLLHVDSTISYSFICLLTLWGVL